MTIDIEERHLGILNTIIKKYDYSFFVFGSRAKGQSKRLSDIDLLYFEDIPNNILLQLEEEFEESDLPYKVDLINYAKCDESFIGAIKQQYICLQKSSKLSMIEQNHIGHFAFLPQTLGFDISDINGVTVINCKLQSSMFNIAYGAPKEGGVSSIVRIKEAFNGNPFAWWVPPSDHNAGLTSSLLEQGFTIETIEHAMICDLERTYSLSQKTDLSIKYVTDKVLLQDFISVIEPYDSFVRNFYERINGEQLKSQERLFVGYKDSVPVTIGILFVNDISAGIFSLITEDSMRGNGYGTDMMVFLMKDAKKSGCKFVTLSASSDSGYRIYENLGFRKIGEFECFEYIG